MEIFVRPMRYKGCHQAHNAKVVICALFTTPNSLKLQERRKAVFTHSQSSCHIAKVVLALTAAISPQRLTVPPRHTSRGFIHWRLSDDGPGASRIVPIGRHPKPFTEGDSSTAATLCIADAKVRGRFSWETMRILTSPYTKRISSPGKFRSSPQKDFATISANSWCNRPAQVVDI